MAVIHEIAILVSDLWRVAALARIIHAGRLLAWGARRAA
jgi:hypothetical protein